MSRSLSDLLANIQFVYTPTYSYHVYTWIKPVQTASAFIKHKYMCLVNSCYINSLLLYYFVYIQISVI